MNTILLPTDFSATSRNSAHYAIAMAKQFGIKKIVLYHAYQIPVVTGDPILPAVQLMDYESFKEASEIHLEHFRLEFVAEAEGIELEAICEINDLGDGINEASKKYGADLIIMGITGGSALEENLIGSNTISISKHSTVPVIIIPSDAKYTPIEEVLFACDFKKVKDTTPIQPIAKIIQLTKAKLFVLHVNPPEEAYEVEMENEVRILNGLLEDLHPEYHFLNREDFTGAINEFAEKKEIDLIITIPKKHGWFEGLFKRSHVKMLAFHSHTPLMVIHE
jgi:nucleotide-binding universal stress UspA family protein